MVPRILLPLLVVSGLACAEALQATPAHGSGGPAPGPLGAAAPRPAHRAPDSLLAEVGTSRRISVSRFLHDWDQVKPPDRPDSLTPQTSREFLQLLIGKEALAEAALKEAPAWTADDSSGYAGLRDHLVLSAAVDSALAAERRRLAAAGDSVPDQGALGIMARDRLIASLGLSYDEPLLERLAGAFEGLPRPSKDSSLTSQLRVLGAMPQVADSLRGRPIAAGREVRYTVADLLDLWWHTNPLTRPRVDSAQQVKELVSNGIFEQTLRREADRQRLAERPDIAQALAARREFIAVTHVVEREVYAKIPMDSLTLERHYHERIDDWSLPLRARLIRLVLGERAAGVRMRLQLADGAAAESLAARGARAGADYRLVVSAETDSALFARSLAAGTGAVLGPDSTRGGWAVTRVTEILPARRRTFGEAHALVAHDWYGKEGERLMQALLDRARHGTRVLVHEKTLAVLTPPARAH
jgi:hypothetical protein